jgi:carbamoyltransferase
LNCVGNGRILREGSFADIWIQPAAGDAGGAVGIALAIWHRYLGKPRLSPEKAGTWRAARDGTGGEIPPYQDGMQGAFLGPRYTEAEIEQFLTRQKCVYKKYSPGALPEVVADYLMAGKIIGLFQGRMEFGPRALGGRSIIGDARSPRMQSIMNLKIKFREGFRPFAPSVLREHVAAWFELEMDSPYMLLVADVVTERRRAMTPEEEALWGIEKLKVIRSEIPAVTHVDYSARVQTLRREVNPFYWDILEAFRQRTGCPVIVNTSFNVRGEPIVCSPEDGYRCFMRTEMDVLVLETCVLEKGWQSRVEEAAGWRQAITPD